MMKFLFSLILSFCSFVLLNTYVSAADTYDNGFYDKYEDAILNTDVPHYWHDNHNYKKIYPFDRSYPDYNEDYTYTIDLVKPIYFRSLYIDSGNSRTQYIKTFRFYNSNGTLLHTYRTPASREVFYHTLNLADVKKITIHKPPRAGIYEFEFFVDPINLYTKVSNITTTTKTHNSAVLSWTNPDNVWFQGNKVYLNDQLLTGSSTTKRTSYSLSNLMPVTQYKVTVSALYEGVEVRRDYYFTTRPDTVPPGDVANLNVVHQVTNKKGEFNSSLTYVLPKDKDFSHVVIYRDGVLLKDNVKSTEFADAGLKGNTEYVYTVHAVDTSGNRSKGVSVSLTIDYDITPPSEVKNLKVKGENDALVSYQLPKDKDFSHVVIYRDGVLLKDNVKSTEFVDTSVKANTKYVYTVHTVDKTGNRSKGVSDKVTMPLNEVKNGTTEEKENGNYDITWDSPIKGKMKVLVGGTQYALVPAADKKITIPASKMKFSIIGTPDIQLIPVDDEGNEGIRSNLSFDGLGPTGDVVNAENALELGKELLVIFGGFILLGLAFRLVPKLMLVISKSIFKKKRSF